VPLICYIFPIPGDVAICDVGITTDINEPLVMVGPTAGFNTAADTAGSHNEQSSK
jgi:hypothetical protein